MQNNLPLGPLHGDSKSFPVASYGVIIFRSIRPGGCKGISFVQVDGITIAFHLPVGRYGNSLPVTVIQVNFIEILYPFAGGCGPVKLPFSVQGNIPLRGPGLILFCQGLGFEGEKICMRSQFVHRKFPMVVVKVLF